MLSVNPHPSARRKGRETYKLSIKTTLLITLIIVIILLIRDIKQNMQNWYWVSRSWVPGCWCTGSSCQALTWRSRTGLNGRKALGSGMHRSESGSGSQAGQWAGSSSEGGHGWREWDPHDPPALNWVWHAWHGIPRWSVSHPLSCLPFPASATPSASSLAGPKSSVVTLAAIVIKRGLFLPSFPTVSSM